MVFRLVERRTHAVVAVENVEHLMIVPGKGVTEMDYVVHLILVAGVVGNVELPMIVPDKGVAGVDYVAHRILAVVVVENVELLTIVRENKNYDYLQNCK